MKITLETLNKMLDLAKRYNLDPIRWEYIGIEFDLEIFPHFTLAQPPTEFDPCLVLQLMDLPIYRDTDGDDFDEWIELFTSDDGAILIVPIMDEDDIEGMRITVDSVNGELFLGDWWE
jgi:hypothetical protein